MKHIARAFIITLIFSGLSFASDIYKVKENQLGSIFIWHLEDALHYIQDQDTEALVQAEEEGKIVLLQAGMEVYIIDANASIEYPTLIMKCRKKGTTTEFYTPSWAVEK